MRVTLFNSIHDSVASRVHVDDVEECKKVAKQAATYDVYDYLDAVYNYSFDFVPLGIGVKVAKSWGRTSIEETWDVEYSGEERYQLKGK